MEIKQSHLVIILVAVVGIASLAVFVIIDLQSQLESEQLSKEQKAKELMEEQLSREQIQSQLESEQFAKAQKEKELEQKQIELEKQKEIEQQQQAELLRKQLELLRKQKELEREQLEAKKSEIEALARTNPFVSGVVKGTLNIYFEPVPSYASDGVFEAVKETSKLLNGYEIYPMTIRVVSNPNNADIIIKWIKDFGSPTLGHAIFKSVVEVGLGEGNCFGDWQAFNAVTVHKILWHELGHSFGFNHSAKPNNIMYSTIPPQFSMDVDKTIDIDEGEYYTMPFCKTGSMNYYLTSDNQSNGFYVYVIPSATDPIKFLNGEGKYYPSCSAEGAMVSFGETCNVGIGDKLIVYNRDDLLKFSSIRVNIQVTDLNEMPQLDFVWDLDVFEYDYIWLAEVYEMFH